MFDPLLVEVFGRLQEKEAFWLDLQPQFLPAAVKEEFRFKDACSLKRRFGNRGNIRPHHRRQESSS